MLKPKLKRFTRIARGGEILIAREIGATITLADSDGQVMALLDLLDGSRTSGEVAAAMQVRWPTLTTADVAEGINGLDAAGLMEDEDAPTELSAWQQERYSSNMAFFSTYASLDRSRYRYQEALGAARVVLLGVGGLGSTVLYNLAGLGVRRLTLLDSDRIELKNLVRQYLYNESEVGMPKLDRAVERIRAFNSELEITAVERRVTGPADVAPLLAGADLVICGIDTPQAVYDWVNEACVNAHVPMIAGGMQVSRGIYYSIHPGRSGCKACLAMRNERNRIDGHTVPAERVNRGMGPVASMMGALVSMEAVRYLTGFAPPVAAGRLWVVDFATGEVQVATAWEREPDCPVCGHLPAGGTP